MANEIILSSLSNETTSEALAAMFLLLLADRNGLPAHPAIMAGYAQSVNARGTNTLKVPHLGIFGYDILATITENSAIANTAYTDGSSTVAVTIRGKQYSLSDLARMVDATGKLNIEAFAIDAVISRNATMLYTAANLMDNFSTVVGTSGAPCTFATYLDSITALEVNKVQGPYLGILHSKTWGDIRKDVASASGGAIVWNQGSQAMLDKLKGIGAQGNFCGVDVFTTAHVPTMNAGADYGSGVFGAGAIVWADGTIPADGIPGTVSLDGGRVLLQQTVTPGAQMLAYVAKAAIGMSEGIDLAGVTIQSSVS